MKRVQGIAEFKPFKLPPSHIFKCLWSWVLTFTKWLELHLWTQSLYNLIGRKVRIYLFLSTFVAFPCGCVRAVTFILWKRIPVPNWPFVEILMWMCELVCFQTKIMSATGAWKRTVHPTRHASLLFLFFSPVSLYIAELTMGRHTQVNFWKSCGARAPSLEWNLGMRPSRLKDSLARKWTCRFLQMADLKKLLEVQGSRQWTRNNYAEARRNMPWNACTVHTVLRCYSELSNSCIT